jgi:cullin-4
MELRPTIKAVIQLFEAMSSSAMLRDMYVAETATHYDTVVEKNVKAVEQGEMSPTRYIEWALEKVEEEKERAQLCFTAVVTQTVVDVVRDKAGRLVGDRVVAPGEFDTWIRRLDKAHADVSVSSG